MTETESICLNKDRFESVLVENINLRKALLVKERLIEDLIKCKSQTNSELNVLMSRLGSTKNKKSLLRYEFRMLEKELEIRNKEMEFATRKHVENATTILKLESQIQRLHTRLQKRVPGPPTLAKIRSENEILHTRRNKNNLLMGVKKSPEIPCMNNISALMERLLALEEENKCLRENLLMKTNEQCICYSVNHDHASLKPLEPSRSNEVSDIRLMDDFVEMEKLALVSVDQPSRINMTDYDWLHDVLRIILNQNHSSKRSVEELIGDIRIGLAFLPTESEPFSTSQGYITWDKEEDIKLNDEGKNSASDRQELEERLLGDNCKNNALMIEQNIRELKREVESLKESKKAVEEQIEIHKSVNEDLNSQLTVAVMNLNEGFQKLSSLEVELAYKSNCCEDLETTCLDLHLQLESAKKNIPEYNLNREEKQIQTLEVTAAKLAECEETILNLGKQLNSLASPGKMVLSTTPYENSGNRAALLDHINAEDDLKCPKMKEIQGAVDTKKSGKCRSSVKDGTFAIVATKKQWRGGFLRKLFLVRKIGKEGSKTCRVDHLSVICIVTVYSCI